MFDLPAHLAGHINYFLYFADQANCKVCKGSPIGQKQALKPSAAWPKTLENGRDVISLDNLKPIPSFSEDHYPGPSIRASLNA